MGGNEVNGYDLGGEEIITPAEPDDSEGTDDDD